MGDQGWATDATAVSGGRGRLVQMSLRKVVSCRVKWRAGQSIELRGLRISVEIVWNSRNQMR
jgi:hypothetical protein